MYGFQSDAQARMSQLPEAEPTYSEQMAADLQRRNRTAKARARREFSDYAQEQADDAPAPADQLLYADGGSVGFGARGVAGLRDMIPKMQAMGYQQAAPAPAAPSAAERLRAMIPQVEAMGYKQQPQALADGGMVHSIKGMLGLRPKTREELLAADAKAQERNREAAARVAERSAQQPAPATPAPQSAITGYAGMSAMQRREKEQGLKNGGMVKPRGFKASGLILGPGTGTSDSIETEKRPGTFIMSADSTQAIGANALEKLATVPVKLSNGEFEFPPEQVMAVGAAVLKLLKDTTHKPVNGEDGGQPDDETGEGAGHEMAEPMPGGQEDDAGEGMGYRPSDRMAQMPPMMFADGGLVENDITRVGNSYSGGNVGGDVSFNGQSGSGTVSTSSWTSPAPVSAPVATAAPTAQQPVAAAATTAATPAPAPAPAAPMGWAERNALRNTQVTASSIQDSPERRAAQAALAPAPMAAPAPVAPPTAAQRFGTLPALGQPAPGEQPRRYADGGTVKDEERAVFGLYPQLADSQRTTYAAAEKLRSGVVASGPSTFAPALKPAPIAQPAIRGGGDGRRMNAQQDPRSLVYAGRPQIAETADVAPAQAAAQGQAPAATVETNAPAALPSGSVSAQDDAAAGAVSRRGAADALAQMPNAPAPVTAPTVRNSTNDWAARKALENMATAASSITNRPEWQSGSTTIAGSTRGPKGEGDPEGKVAAYKAALANDLALQQAQPGLDQTAMRENAGIQREALQQAGATTRTGMTEQGSNTREAGRTALAQGELGLKREAQGFQTRALQRLEKLYERYDAAKTPEERAGIAQQLRELQVKDAPARMQTVTLPDTTNEMGRVVRGGQALVRELRDGTVQQVPIGAAPAPQALPPKDQLKAGKTYSTPRGQARWDGNQFIPV